MLKVNSFLGCVSLRTGVLLIGLLGLALQSAQFLIYGVLGSSNLPFNFIYAYQYGIYGNGVTIKNEYDLANSSRPISFLTEHCKLFFDALQFWTMLFPRGFTFMRSYGL
jgi:hypothetical protein